MIMMLIISLYQAIIKAMSLIKKQNNVLKGILWTVSSAFFSGIMINMVKHVSAELNTAEIIFFRNVFAFAIFIPIIVYIGISKFKTKRLGIHFLRSATGLTSMMIYFYTVSQMNISVITALSFTAPLFTAIFAVYFFKDKMTIHQGFALFVGFVGVLIVARPDSEAFNPLSLLILVCTLFWALSGILIKKLSETESALQTTFYMTCFMMAFSAPIAFFSWNGPSNENLIWLFGIAATSNLLQYSLAKSLACTDFSVILPFDFTRLLFSAGIAYIAFGEDMDIHAVIGSVVILASAFYAAFTERRKVTRLAQVSQLNREF